MKTLDITLRYVQLIRSALLLSLDTHVDSEPHDRNHHAAATIADRSSHSLARDAYAHPSIILRPGDQSIRPYTRAMIQLALGKPSTPVPSVSANTRVIDGLGHAREAYRGIARFVQHTIAPNSPRVDSSNPLHHRALEFPIHAHHAAAATEWIWDAILRNDSNERSRFVDSVVRGRFVRFDSADNPEPLWYHEIILLHAAATWAHQSKDARLQQVVLEASTYVVNEVQPDHASGQPWAIHALLTHPDGWTLVDLMLHAAGIQQPAAMDDVSLLLLADAYRCLNTNA